KNGSFIEFNSTQIDKIEVYFLILENKNNCPSNLEFKLISNQCIVSKFNFDINKTNSVKPIKDRFLVFPIPDVTENSKIRTVIKIKSDYSLLFRVKFFEKYNYKFSKEKEYLFIGFFYGFIFIMMIYSLFSYILMKERLYFYFFIYTVSLILLDISITGSIIIFVDISNWILKNSKILSMPFAMFSIALLVKKVLSLEEVYKIEKSLIEVARFIPAFVLGYILILDNSNSIQLLFLSIMTFSCILIGITIRPSFKGNKFALLVLSSFFPLLILSINNILVNFWVIPVEFYIWNTIKITGAFQVVVFAFALSYKLRIEQGEIKHKENQIETAIKEKTGVLSKTIQKLEKKENEFNLELKLAHELQNEMVPAEKGVYPLINYKYYYEFPVTIGGDFFDIIVRKDDSIGVYIADASGHGIAAALLTFMYRTGFSNSIINTNSPQEMLQEINSQATNVMTTHNYMTCFLVFLDTKGNMTYSSAGHRPAFIYRRKQNVVEILATKGFFLGMDKNIFSIEEKKTKIDIGDRILL
ncbi:MAG: SpoIIE family protein phosphatase, partial [Leptospiraceae bacterium]|nr:SpoIIE family protein phosphatase [Leptospiraceae bacterium]